MVTKNINNKILMVNVFLLLVTVIFISILNILSKYSDFLIEYFLDINLYLLISLIIALDVILSVIITKIIFNFPYKLTLSKINEFEKVLSQVNPDDGIIFSILIFVFCFILSLIFLIFNSIYSTNVFPSEQILYFSVIFLFLFFYYVLLSTNPSRRLNKALNVLELMDDEFKSANEINTFNRFLKSGLSNIKLKIQKDCSLNNFMFAKNKYQFKDFVRRINAYLFYGGNQAKEEIRMFLKNINNSLDNSKVNGNLLLQHIVDMDNRMTKFFDKKSIVIEKSFSFGSSFFDVLKNPELHKAIVLILAYFLYYYVTKLDIPFPD